MSLRHAILVVLENRNCSGYDIAREFDHNMNYVWQASHQQIYQELSRLKERGWVDFQLEPQAGKPDKKIYFLTESGREELFRWLDKPTPPAQLKDPLMIKMAAGHLESTANLLREIASQKSEYEKKLNILLRLERYYFSYDRTFQATYRIKYLALRRNILTYQTWLDWACEVETELAQRNLNTSISNTNSPSS